jgi:hypothetical protein
VTRSLLWKRRRPETLRLLDAVKSPSRGFEAVVIGEPQRAWERAGNATGAELLRRFGLTDDGSPATSRQGEDRSLYARNVRR